MVRRIAPPSRYSGEGAGGRGKSLSNVNRRSIAARPSPRSTQHLSSAAHAVREARVVIPREPWRPRDLGKRRRARPRDPSSESLLGMTTTCEADERFWEYREGGVIASASIEPLRVRALQLPLQILRHLLVLLQ